MKKLILERITEVEKTKKLLDDMVKDEIYDQEQMLVPINDELTFLYSLLEYDNSPQPSSN